MEGLSSENISGIRLGARSALELLDLPEAALLRILQLLGTGGRGAYASCRQLRGLWLSDIVQHLLRRYGRRAAVPALFGPCAEVPRTLLRPTQSGGQANGLPDEATQAQQLQREGEAALELLRGLYAAGAQREPNVLLMAARAGYVEVVRDVLGTGLEGLDLRQALRLALENARHVDRAQELVQALEEAGAILDPDARLLALTRNPNHGVAGQLLEALGLRAAVHQDKILQFALQTRNVTLAHELLDAGARPLPGCVEAASFTGDVALFARVLRAGAGPAERHSLYVVARHDRSGMLVQQMIDTFTEPPFDKATLLRAFQAACERNNINSVDVLQRTGVNPAAVKALEWSASRGHTGMVRLLLGSYPSHLEGSALRSALANAMIAACGGGHVETVQELLAAGAESGLGLVEAAQKNQMHVVRALLEVGGSRVHGEYNMQLALCVACRIGSLEVVRELLRAGVEPGEGLVDAAEMERPEVLRALLDTGRCPPGHARVAAALETARRSGSSQAAELLATWQGNAEPQALALGHM